jgi:hypothetical protein
MTSVSTWPRARPLAVPLLVMATLMGCTASSPATASETASPDATIVAEVASYQLVANQPGRLLLALLSGDGRWLSFGNVRVSYTFLGTGSATASHRC